MNIHSIKLMLTNQKACKPRRQGASTHLPQANGLGEDPGGVLLLQLVQHRAQQHGERGQPQLQRHLLHLHLGEPALALA